jgi:hypothetical protein
MSTEMIALAFSQAGIWVGLFAIAQRARGRLILKHLFLLFAFASFLEGVAAWMVVRWVLPVDGTLVAFNLWLWWNDGGDDDTKRRLRKLKKKLTPVRRMAPVTA